MSVAKDLADFEKRLYKSAADFLYDTYCKLFEQFGKHKHPGRRQLVRQDFAVIINNQKYIPMGNIPLQLGQGAYPPQPVLEDAVSLAAIPGAVPTLVSLTTDNPAVCAVDANNNWQPQASGTCNTTIVNSWNYTDEVTGLPVVGKLETTTKGLTITSGPEQVVQDVTAGAPVASVPPAAAAPAAAAAPTS